MLATRTSVTPRRAERVAEDERDRSHLRVVVERRLPGRWGAAIVISVFAVLLATAALNTVLVANQRGLDRAEEQIGEAELRNQGLRLRVAELEAPARIKAAAAAQGMVEPEEVTWLTPEPDGGSHAVVERRTGADEPVTPAGGDDRAGSGEGADEDTAEDGEEDIDGAGEVDDEAHRADDHTADDASGDRSGVETTDHEG